VTRAEDRQRTARERASLGSLLDRNVRLREVFANEPEQRQRLRELQLWQTARLTRTHADLLGDRRYRDAAEFFLEELYATENAKARDRDLLRTQRIMERMLPRDALHALTLAVELEILSQELDAQMVRALAPGPISDESYAEAYRTVGRREDRERQIQLIRECGQYLDQLVRLPMIHALVRLTRGPAHAAGFGAMQEFLERGLDAFQNMGRSNVFVATVTRRETEVMERIFAADPDPFRSAA
jgi:hypothetical protein